MTKIIVILTNFRHGGTNKSLENLLSLIDTKEYQFDVFAFDHFGPYKKMLPNCNILPEDKWLSALFARYNDTMGIAKLKSLLIKLLKIICSKLNFNINDILFKDLIKSLFKNNQYDVVIAYSEGVPTEFTSHINHPNKIAWIHCDYSSYMKLNNQPNESEFYKSFRTIVCVSDYTKLEFCKIMPLLCNVTFSMHNFLNIQDMFLKAGIKSTDTRFNKDKFTLISIGTFYPIKRLSLIPDIANDLLKRGIDFKWYVIGSVGDMDEYNSFKSKIENYKISNFVQYLGEKNNPYYYLKNSDLFVSLSLTEACPYVINESKALHIPIVCTDFYSAPEFVENGVIGFIAPIDEVVNKIEMLIKDTSLYQSIKDNSDKNNFDNMKLMNKFKKIINI